MKKHKTYKDEMPEGELTRVKDFLPPPDQLIFPDHRVKVTIQLSQSSIDFFRHAARKHHTKYQRMIREVLDRYAAHHNTT